MVEQTGQLIAGRYRLRRCLAKGGMGSVWTAEHVELGNEVALKLLRSDLSDDKNGVRRFRREARAAALLKSPHIVRIQDFGVDAGVPFIAMELLDGEDLSLRLQREGKLSPQDSLRFLSEAARGLAVAHAAGIVHRDVKPANLFLERLENQELIKVVDFGIARQTSGEDASTTGSVLWGTPTYMSPEQARGRQVDPRTDVWALAGVFFRMLTGHPPFSGDSQHDIIIKLCTEAFTPPSELDPSLPPALDDFFLQALARDPEARIGSVQELSERATQALDLPAERGSNADFRETSVRRSQPGRTTETVPIRPFSSHDGLHHDGSRHESPPQDESSNAVTPGTLTADQRRPQQNQRRPQQDELKPQAKVLSTPRKFLAGTATALLIGWALGLPTWPAPSRESGRSNHSEQAPVPKETPAPTSPQSQAADGTEALVNEAEAPPQAVGSPLPEPPRDHPQPSSRTIDETKPADTAGPTDETKPADTAEPADETESPETRTDPTTKNPRRSPLLPQASSAPSKASKRSPTDDEDDSSDDRTTRTDPLFGLPLDGAEAPVPGDEDPSPRQKESAP